MSDPMFPPEIARDLLVMTVSSSGVSLSSPELKRWHIPTIYEYFEGMKLDKTYYGKYYIVPHDGVYDSIYEKLAPYELPLLTICKRVGQKNVFLLPLPRSMTANGREEARRLRLKDTPFSSKRNRLVWYGGFSGPLPPKYNVRCHFVRHAANSLDLLGLPHDIKFTHLFGRDKEYEPGFGRYEPGNVAAEEQLRNKYLVSLDGNCGASNLGWGLSASSLLLRNRSLWRCLLDEFFFDGVDYLSFANDLSDFEAKVFYALEHEEEIERIVLNSSLKSHGLTPEAIDEHVKQSLLKTLERQ